MTTLPDLWSRNLEHFNIALCKGLAPSVVNLRVLPTGSFTAVSNTSTLAPTPDYGWSADYVKTVFFRRILSRAAPDVHLAPPVPPVPDYGWTPPQGLQPVPPKPFKYEEILRGTASFPSEVTTEQWMSEPVIPAFLKLPAFDRRRINSFIDLQNLIPVVATYNYGWNASYSIPRFRNLLPQVPPAVHFASAPLVPTYDYGWAHDVRQHIFHRWTPTLVMPTFTYWNPAVVMITGGDAIDTTDRELQKNDINRKLQIATGIDLTLLGLTGMTITVMRPDGTTYSMTNSLTIVDASNGLIYARTSAGELNQVGQYFLQVVINTGGTVIASDIVDFWVDDTL